MHGGLGEPRREEVVRIDKVRISTQEEEAERPLAHPLDVGVPPEDAHIDLDQAGLLQVGLQDRRDVTSASSVP